MTSSPRFSDKWHLLGAILADPKMTDAARRCAWVLLDYHNLKTGACYPSYPAIARRAGLCVRAAIDGVAKLIDGNWFRKSRRGGRGHSNHYEPAFERVQDAAPFEDSETVSPDAPFTGDKGCTVEQETVQRLTVNSAPLSKETVHRHAPESGILTRDSKQQHHQGMNDDADDDARRLADFFLETRHQLYPRAKPVRRDATVQAARELLELIGGDNSAAEMFIEGCMEGMVRQGFRPPTSPLFCRHTIENAMRAGDDD